MTQQQLAQQCSVRKGAVSEWETGKQYPNASHLATIEGLFGAPREAVEPRVAERGAVYGNPSRLGDLTPDEVRIVEIYRWLVSQSEGGK